MFARVVSAPTVAEPRGLLLPLLARIQPLDIAALLYELGRRRAATLEGVGRADLAGLQPDIQARDFVDGLVVGHQEDGAALKLVGLLLDLPRLPIREDRLALFAVAHDHVEFT